jgi:hypothetical protein
MATPLDLFSNIKQAALEIAYDNSAADTKELEIAYLARANGFLENLPVIKLIAMNIWLGGLSPNDLSLACIGEEKEMQEVMATAPDHEFAEQVLVDIFLAV